jgi:single-strand DNA-binding protein
MNLNKVMLGGRVTRDTELRHTPKGTAVADIAIAVNRVFTNEQGQKTEESTFVDVTLWGRQAEIASQYLHKGSPVFVEGRIQMDSWVDKQSGEKRNRLKVVGEHLQLLGDRRESAGASTAPAATVARAPQPRPVGPRELDRDVEPEDIPF